MDYKNILIDTDGSKIMDGLYKHAIYLAKLLDVNTQIVNVIDVSSLLLHQSIELGTEFLRLCWLKEMKLHRTQRDYLQ